MRSNARVMDMEYSVPATIRNPKLLEDGRARIVQAAIELFSKRGFHRTSVEEIAEAAGFTVGALYKYIRSKHDILFLTGMYISSVMSDVLTEILDAKIDPKEKLRRAIDTYVRTVDRFAGAIRISYRESANLDPEARSHVFGSYQQIRDEFVEVLTPVAKMHGIRDDLAIRVIGDNLVSLGHMWAVNHRAYAEHLTLDSFIDMQTELALRQLSTSTPAVRASVAA